MNDDHFKVNGQNREWVIRDELLEIKRRRRRGLGVVWKGREERGKMVGGRNT